MKKISFCCVVSLIYLLMLAGCTGSADAGSSDEGAVDQRYNIPFADDQYYAVAHLGYQQITGLDDYVQQYLEHDKIPIHYLSAGDYYLVVPRYAGMSLSLFQNDFETSEAVLIFETPDCQPFIIQCNVSDIFADATIRLSCEAGSAEFSPFISLKDGELDIGPKGLDITQKQPYQK